MLPSVQAGKGAINVKSMFVSHPNIQTSMSIDIWGTLGRVFVTGCSQTAFPPVNFGQMVKFDSCIVDTLTITGNAIGGTNNADGVGIDGYSTIGLDTFEVCAGSADSALTSSP